MVVGSKKLITISNSLSLLILSPFPPMKLLTLLLIFNLNLALSHASHHTTKLKPSGSHSGDKYWCFLDTDVEGLPDRVDLRNSPFMPAVYDQGHLGSCTANAIAAAIQFDERKQGAPKSSLIPSRLFIYYNERNREGHVGQDAGASLRDGIEAVTQQGYCYENVWPYSDDLARATTKPSQQCFEEAKEHRVLQYMRVRPTIDDIRAVIASEVPVIIGLQYFPQLYQGAQLPNPGGHASYLIQHHLLPFNHFMLGILAGWL